jgi:Fe-S-cluster containining protein
LFSSFSSNNSNNNNNNDNDNDWSMEMDDLTAYLARQEEVAQLESISNVWYNNNNQDTTTTTTGTQQQQQQQQQQRQLLPFECTACGKCCQTKGSVWMSPEEVTKASDLLDISVVTFVDLYASHIIRSDDDDNDDNNDIDNDNDDHDNNNDMTTRKTTTTTKQQPPPPPPWVKLTNNSEQHCVFLKDKLCQIYEARPSQCSTYPFWPTIMKSPTSWNREVRLSKEDIIIDNDNDDPTTSQQQQQQESSIFVPPYWTSELGGCEGMKLVEMNGMDGTTTTTTTTTTTSSTSSSSTIVVVVGVDPLTAYQQLQQYERDERRFPIGKKQIPVVPDDA